MKKPIILGLSATLRNARSSASGANLVQELEGLDSRENLNQFITDQAKIHLDQFIAAGRADDVPFDEMYRRLRKLGGTRGLSNSEVCLVAALWAARNGGVQIEHTSLADHFPASGEAVDIDRLKQQLRQADGIILATPVYFGDRSSLSQVFIEMLRTDEILQRDLAGKIYAGISVGAKRNGGQETALIYQMLDMVDMGILAVGNDSETTSQYGGTGHAGDIGTMPKDTYGIETSLGVGRRIAHVALLLEAGKDFVLNDTLRLGLWILQDRDGEIDKRLRPVIDSIIADAQLDIKLKTTNFTEDPIRPCIACDICPTHVGPDTEYRCIIGLQSDGLLKHHQDLLEVDVLMPAVFSPGSREGLISVYQQFMERTRYLRRGDYVFSDRLVVPIVFVEVGVNEHMDVRMLTSFIRHHTVMQKPVVGLIHKGKILNPDDVANALRAAIAQGRLLLQGRLAATDSMPDKLRYNPVGYILSQAKDQETDSIHARELLVKQRNRDSLREKAERLSIEDPTS
ncbi:MAG: flavodoxin family protein [Rhodospirillales bacterium]|nr:flavodoxin family protein [Rhodospirillales bacterium]